jgi:adenylate kinase
MAGFERKSGRVAAGYRIIITGTPGTGKTVIACALCKILKAKLFDVNEIVKRKKLYSRIEDGCLVVDLKALKTELDEAFKAANNVVAEGHVLCELPVKADYVFVLRTRPDKLRERLERKGWNDKKIEDNVEAEILDYCTIHALRNYKNAKVFEIESTDKSAEQIAKDIVSIFSKTKMKAGAIRAVGKIDWTGYL